MDLNLARSSSEIMIVMFTWDLVVWKRVSFSYLLLKNLLWSHILFEIGEAAKKKIIEEVPKKADKIEVLQIDVGDYGSVLAAAKSLRDRKVTLYGLVNNAGIGLSTGNDTDTIMNTNYYGVKRVTEAFVDLIDKMNGRIVNTSSGVAPMWIRDRVISK